MAQKRVRPPRRTILSMGLALLAAPRAAFSVETPQKKAAADDPLSILQADAVYGDSFAARVLYSWTTADQIAELRKNPTLLTREESPQHGPAHFDLVMQAQASTGDKVAQLLRTKAFRRARFGWSNPWATLRGWATENYGDQLLRITLRDDAYFAAYSTHTRAFRFVDAHDQKVTKDSVLAAPQRLAAVYFVEDSPRSGTQWASSPKDGAPYREYVLCNEAMIASYEAGTDAVRQALMHSITAMAALRKELPKQLPKELQGPTPNLLGWQVRQPLRWQSRQAPKNLRDAYEVGLAFPNSLYVPGPPQLEALHQALTKTLANQPAPLQHP